MLLSTSHHQAHQEGEVLSPPHRLRNKQRIVNPLKLQGLGSSGFCSLNAADTAVRLALTPLHPHSSLPCCFLVSEDRELLREGSCLTPEKAFHILCCVSNSNYPDIIRLDNSALKNKVPIQPKESLDWNSPLLLKYKGWSLMPCI